MATPFERQLVDRRKRLESLYAAKQQELQCWLDREREQEDGLKQVWEALSEEYRYYGDGFIQLTGNADMDWDLTQDQDQMLGELTRTRGTIQAIETELAVAQRKIADCTRAKVVAATSNL